VSLPPDRIDAALLATPPSAGLRRIAFLLDRVIGTVAEAIGAALVLAEVAILFCGVVARYVFDAPLIWSDELATFLFLWLCMLGAVVALRRGGHMRLTTLVSWVPPPVAAWFESIGALVVVAFVLEILLPATQYVNEQAYTELTTLNISDAWRAAAILVGGIMAAVIAVLRLLETAGPRALLAGVLTVGAIALVLWLAEPLLIAMGRGSLVLFFIVIVGACVAIGVPIAFAFGISTVSYLALTSTMPLSVVVNRMDDGMSNLLLLSVPMFVFLGLLMEMTGIARVMVNFLASLLGHVRGGLSYVLLGAMYLVSGISGSKAADMAAVAPVLFPEMRRRGIHPGELACLLASSSAMSETIPPSLVLITIGSVTNVSIAALFTGGLLPAALASAGLAILVFFRTRKDRPGGRRASAREIGRLFVVGVPALVLPFVIRYAVLAGVTTATEVATVGVVYAVLVGIAVYRCFDWRKLMPILVGTASLSGAILLIIGTATSMAWALTQSGFSRQLAAFMAAMPGGWFGYMLISIVAFVVLGSVLEGIPAIVLFGPLLFPIARQVGINEVHYAMVVILAMGIGLFAPPLGVGYYAACAIGRVSPDVGMRRIWPYLGALLIGLLAVAAIPWISTGFL